MSASFPRYHRQMLRWPIAATVALTAASCTVRDHYPPFTCTPGEFIECSGDEESRCNAAGNGYDTVACDRGCGAAGCILCDPNETACTNDILATCDASGNVVSQEECLLGCFEDQPRCADIDPSNDLAPYLDMAAAAEDLALPDTAVVSTIDGSVTVGGNTTMPTSFLVAAPPGGVGMRVFVADDVTIGSIVFAQPPSEMMVPAFVVVANGAIRISGRIDLGSGRTPPGSFTSASGNACLGVPGQIGSGPNGQMYVGGSGGGGNATAGARGGDITGEASGGGGGLPNPNPDLSPLRGGCASGDAYGGGAVQLVSRHSITLDPVASIDAPGHGGGADQDVVYGGGSGGGILLEAPIVALGSLSSLTCNGGGGGSGIGGSVGTNGQPSTTPAPGGACAGSLCSDGGNGGAGSSLPDDGENVTPVTTPDVYQFAGGGGGSIGVIRINTADGTYEKAGDSIESPAPSTAAVATR
jgi:hypothetical protein